jgi:hypothetical protein
MEGTTMNAEKPSPKNARVTKLVAAAELKLRQAHGLCLYYGRTDRAKDMEKAAGMVADLKT